MALISKPHLIELILSNLDAEIASLTLSAQAAHEAATHDESKAEDSHDTRGLEASYLAGAQHARIQALLKVATFFRLLKVRDFQSAEAIAIGACIELQLEGKCSYYFLASQGGGISVLLEGKSIQVITPQAPLGDALLDRHVGDWIEVDGRNGLREYRITSIG